MEAVQQWCPGFAWAAGSNSSGAANGTPGSSRGGCSNGSGSGLEGVACQVLSWLQGLWDEPQAVSCYTSKQPGEAGMLAGAEGWGCVWVGRVYHLP